MPLFIVATPIGNFADMTYRAVTVLKEADLILAEDTRVSRKLLDHYGINAPVTAYHDFNKERVTPHLIERLRNNEKLALISDAGTPGIADPAFNLVRAALREKLPVFPIPGPSAHITALIASGLPTDRFVFENFLPRKSAQRRRLFEALKDEPRTVIFYETPHRIVKVLEELDSVIGDIAVVIGRELTKLHEEFLRGTPKTLLERFAQRPPRGEMAVMINVRVREAFPEGEEAGDSSQESGDRSQKAKR
ncbi:MAG: 16S rRNA (cytidine(1402)-2'-O)-methyltransferase [Chitinispirillaceae bacterium]|nr:16S rRNA (cytidine(1402)-2'-O)-methyltransferase [Chitinispirillaceae bacterium]